MRRMPHICSHVNLPHRSNPLEAIRGVSVIYQDDDWRGGGEKKPGDKSSTTPTNFLLATCKHKYGMLYGRKANRSAVAIGFALNSFGLAPFVSAYLLKTDQLRLHTNPFLIYTRAQCNRNERELGESESRLSAGGRREGIKPSDRHFVYNCLFPMRPLSITCSNGFLSPRTHDTCR